MSKFKKLFKSKIFKTIAPIALGFIPGVGPLLGASLGAGIGAVGGGGLKGALLGGAGGFLGAGGLGKVAGSALGGGLSGPTQGSGFLGSLTRGSGAFSSGLRSIAGGIGGLKNSLFSGLGLGGAGGGSSLFGNVLGRGFGNTLLNGIGGFSSDKALRRARDAQLQANSQAIGTISPFLTTGTRANNRLSSALGLNGESPDDIFAQLRGTPGYQFQLDEGQRALDRSQSARGSLFSGRAIREGQRFGQGLASQVYNDYLNRLANQSAQGLRSAGATNNLLGFGGAIRSGAILDRNQNLNRSLGNILQPRA